MNIDDIGVLQPGHCVRLRKKAIDKPAVNGNIRGQNFQGDFPVQVELEGLINNRHTAAVDFFNDSIFTNGRTDLKKRAFEGRKNIVDFYLEFINGFLKNLSGFFIEIF